MKYFARFGTMLKPTLLLKYHSSMGVFHIFKIVQMLPKSNKASHILNEDKMLEYVEINKFRRQTMMSGSLGTHFLYKC